MRRLLAAVLIVGGCALLAFLRILFRILISLARFYRTWMRSARPKNSAIGNY